MKKFLLFSTSVFLTFIAPGAGYADYPPPSEMNTTSTPSSTIESFKPLEKSKSGSITNTPGGSTKYGPPPVIKISPPVPQKASYFHPGILVNRDGVWEGSDHLLNLTNNIGVYVSILKPEDANIAITEGDVQKQVELIFQQAKIKPQTMAPIEKPALPLFEIEILLYPVERGYVASLTGRLFESVILERFKLDPDMAFQAVTWEKQTLIVGPKTKFIDQLTAAITDITGSFAERFETFEKLKNK